MGITLPELPPPAHDEEGPYCVIARHRALPGKQFVIDSAEYIDGDMQVQWLAMRTEYQ